MGLGVEGKADVEQAAKVLVVEDEPALLDTLSYSLRRQGYEVATAADGLAALEVARQVRPDVIVLDLMLPRLDGFEVCRILRQEMSAPILMLTARSDEVDKVVGLEVGADDYLTKPFSMRELVARVKAQLRRVRMVRDEVREAVRGEAEQAALGNGAGDGAAGQLVFGNLVIDLNRHEVRLEGRPIHLKPKEFDLLTYLARHHGMALSRELMLERIWGWEYDGGSRTVDVHVRWLREKIEQDPGNPTRIVTVRGAGYRFEG